MLSGSGAAEPEDFLKISAWTRTVERASAEKYSTPGARKYVRRFRTPLRREGHDRVSAAMIRAGEPFEAAPYCCYPVFG